MQWSLGGPDEAALLMRDVHSEISTADHMPPPVELLVHVLLDFLGHFLLIGASVEGMADDVFGLVLDLRLHL